MARSWKVSPAFPNEHNLFTLSFVAVFPHICTQPGRHLASCNGAEPLVDQFVASYSILQIRRRIECVHSYIFPSLVNQVFGLRRKVLGLDHINLSCFWNWITELMVAICCLENIPFCFRNPIEILVTNLAP